MLRCGLLVFFLNATRLHRKGVGLQVQGGATEDKKQYDPFPIETDERRYRYQQQQHGRQRREGLEAENRPCQGGD